MFFALLCAVAAVVVALTGGGLGFQVTVFLLVAEHISARMKARTEQPTIPQAIAMGCMQGVALLPGVSRSGSTLAGGLLCGLELKSAAKFSFMMSAPAIVAALLLEGYDVIDSGARPGADAPGTPGAPVSSGVAEPSAVRPAALLADDLDFLPITITDPDQATQAMALALSEVYDGRVEADEHDVFTVPAGCVVVFVRAHRSMPLIVFRSPLVPAVEDAAAAETEVAILNRDSLWCRYIFDGKAVYAESEFVDRVFVPVNFKIQLAEISAELDDVYPDLARRVAAKQWRDLHSADDPGASEQ